MLARARVNRRWLAGIALFVVACLVAGAVIFPVRTGQVGFDSAASVLYFQRIVAGRHLEAPITATPKPLLTLLYGLAYALTHDWRSISWLAIAAFAASVVLGAVLAARLSGPGAAGFAAAALLGSSALLTDVALAYALVWALLGWLVAGLALTAATPRFGLAGLGFLLAGTARFESLILSVAAVTLLAVWWLLARWREGSRQPASAWLLGLGLLALPIQIVHDLLLTGDPWYSEVVPVQASVGATLLGPEDRVVWIAERYLANGGLLFLAVLGVIGLLAARRWPILVGLAVLGPGIGAFLVFLELRHVYVSNRYAGPIDLAVVFAAALGFTLLVPSVPRWLRAGEAATLVALGILAGILFSSPYAPLSSDVVGVARSNLTLHGDLEAAEPAIARFLSTRQPTQAGARSGARPVLLVPVLLRPQVAVDMALDLTDVGSVGPAQLPPTGDALQPGMIVLHDTRGDGAEAAFRIFEVAGPTTVGGLRVIPVDSNPARGWWVVSIEAASG